jgi:hypothetical protein
MTLVIRKYSSINSSGAFVNAIPALENSEDLEFKKFMKALYRHLGMDYPKYFKMDGLSKIGLLTIEILLQDENLQDQYPGERIAMILTNASSSIEVDKKHWETIKDRKNYFPSPSNFVYTLPNIMAGEAAIRHQLKGENTVFISNGFDPALICELTHLTFASGVVDCCIAGWVEHSSNNYESLLFIIEEAEKSKLKGKSSEDIIFEPSKLLDLYKKNTNGRINSKT